MFCVQDDLGFLGRMSNLLLGDDTDDAEVNGSSPLGDESGALLVRLAYRGVYLYFNYRSCVGD